MRILERIFQVTVFVVAGFMIWGGGIFWRQAVADNYTQTQTYTLYKALTPPPLGPRQAWRGRGARACGVAGTPR